MDILSDIFYISCFENDESIFIERKLYQSSLYIISENILFRYLYVISHMTEFRNYQYPVLIGALREIYILNKQLQMLI